MRRILRSGEFVLCEPVIVVVSVVRYLCEWTQMTT